MHNEINQKEFFYLHIKKKNYVFLKYMLLFKLSNNNSLTLILKIKGLYGYFNWNTSTSSI